MASIKCCQGTAKDHRTGESIPMRESERERGGNHKKKLHLLAAELDRDKLIMRWARETIVKDRIAQNSDEDLQSCNIK